ncbi:sterol 26-hydroxylase, mitochondrial-like isoform X1 [Protopterus annectens]|uniref:sterol 26-hydroxylase, mitochondrial-like isoform X1 n=1 Tax=Protopterus annectens TaxID=7888 RepID=UPI001CFB094E|nr:sterol 26-hydroxylase, mitochondrial-like isoform X1 [Protopterus annectens]
MASWLVSSARSHFYVRGAYQSLLQSFVVAPSILRHASLTSEAASASTEDSKQLGSPDELPGPNLFSSLYWILVRGYITHTQDLQVVHKKMYGPIWKSTFGPYTNINIASAELIEEVLRQEGKYPMRCDMALWREHRDERGFTYGPFTEEGERWYQLRANLNQRILKPKDAALYTGVINEVISDLIQKLYYIRGNSPSEVLVTDVANEFYRFAFEGICCVLFETRMGCLEKVIPSETQDFINSIGYMLYNSVFATILPKWTRRIFPFWDRYMKGWDTMFQYGKMLVDKKMETIQARIDRGEEIQGEYLTSMLAGGKLSMKEIYGSMVELLLAGVDTTSNTLAWTLYHLAKDPKIQNSLYQEVNDVVSDRVPTTNDIARMPLLKAVIKETLRMYPVVPSNGRVPEKEVVVNGISFPKNTLFHLCHYAVSHDEINFPEPKKFNPNRWLRDVGFKHHPFSSIPFGYGVRACVGRRIAELEMHLALIAIMKTFEVRPGPDCENVIPVARTVLVANKPINLLFIERQSVTSA